MNSDLTKILHLADKRGQGLLAFYGFGTALVALLNLGGLIVPWQGILSLLLMGIALGLLGWRGPTPFSLRRSLIVIGIVVMVALLSAWNLQNVTAPGYSGWYLGAMTILLLVLGLRGRRALAWTGFALLTAVALLSTVSTGQSLVAGINDIARQAGTLFIGTLFALVLRRAGNVIALIQQRQLVRVEAEAATAAATRERATQNARLEEHARPALERLLSADPLTEGERANMALLEAELRDGIRAAGLNRHSIMSEARAARARGIQVVLVDDRGSELEDGDLDRVEEALLSELRAVKSGTVTARLSSFDSDEIATVVVAEDGAYRSVIVTPHETSITKLS